jgi:hypothetical protein
MGSAKKKTMPERDNYQSHLLAHLCVLTKNVKPTGTVVEAVKNYPLLTWSK